MAFSLPARRRSQASFTTRIAQISSLLLQKKLSNFKVHYFHLLGILATPLRNTPLFQFILNTLDLIYSVILKIPGVRLMAWQMIFFLNKPKK
jgi:hypothetical protein